jgi:hypothetical protein
VRRAWQRLGELPLPIRETAVAFLRVAGPRLRKVRRPRDLRALAHDAEVVEALGGQLVPVLEELIKTASTAPLPMRRRWSTHASATVTGAVGPALATSAELVALFGGPESLAVTAPTAFAAQTAASVWELYVTFSLIVRKLRRAGVQDPRLVRLALMRTLVPDAGDVTKAVLVRGGERIAVRLLSRGTSAWIPLAGPVFGAVDANIDVHRAHRAVESVLRDRTDDSQA